METNPRRYNYSPIVKRSFTPPPTEEMRRVAAAVVIRNRPSDHEQFMDEVRMLGLEDLIFA